MMIAFDASLLCYAGTNDYGSFRAAMAGSEQACIDLHHNVLANITCFEHG
jgi:hypothetical protein